MRRALLAALAIASLAPVGAAATDRSPRTRTGDLEVHIARSDTTSHVTRLLVCDHRTGRRRVLRRAAYRIPDELLAAAP